MGWAHIHLGGGDEVSCWYGWIRGMFYVGRLDWMGDSFRVGKVWYMYLTGICLDIVGYNLR